MAKQKFRNDAQQSLLPLAESAESDRRALVRGALAHKGLQARVAEDLERLILYLDWNDQTNTGCRARIQTISNFLRRPTRSVKRRLAELREWGLIETTRPDWLPVNRVVWDQVRSLAFAARAQASEPVSKKWPHSGQSGTTSGQSGTTSGQSGPPIVNSIEPYKKPPPTPSEKTGEGWGVVVSELEQAGMARAQSAAQSARSRGLSPAEVQGLLAHWNANRPAWGIGALYRVLQDAQSGEEPSEAPWPPKSEAWEIQQRRATADRRQQQQAAELEQQRTAKEADLAKLAQLEREHGPRLDALSDQAYRQLVASHAPALVSIHQAHGRDSPMVRETLLAALEKQTENHHAPAV